MSELQGSGILDEERSGRRRSLWWITAGVVALLPLALLIPFACQTLRRGSDSQGGGSGAQQTTGAQDADCGQGGGREGAGEGQEPAGIEETTDAQAAGGARGAAAGQLASIGEVRSADGRTGTVPRPTISGVDGRIAIHQNAGGEPQVLQCLRHAPLREGENPNVEVELDRAVASSQRMYAMVHADDPAGGRYTFPDGDPPDLAGGELAVEPFRYAVSGEEAGGRPPATEPKLRGPKPCRKAV